MEVRDGFIVGISNYCDQWCAACAFTSRCRLFAELAEAEGALDPNFKAVVDAPPLPQDVSPPPPAWMRGMLEEMDAHRTSSAEAGLQRIRRGVPLHHESIRARADAYRQRAHDWLRSCGVAFVHDPADPHAVVRWFHTLIPVKIVRALMGLASDMPDARDWPADHDGCAKVALLGIERSHVALLQLSAGGGASSEAVQPLIADLVWLGEALERVFPNARTFVRPAFDEPEEVARLRAAEDGDRGEGGAR